MGVAPESQVIPVGSKLTVVAVTPTIDTAAYASGDTLTPVMTFADVAIAAGGSGCIVGLTVVDAAAQSAAAELWLFTASPTVPALNAAWSISDADAATCIGVIPFGPYYASALNSVSCKSVTFPFVTGATTAIYGVAVIRAAGTYAATDLKFVLRVAKD